MGKKILKPVIEKVLKVKIDPSSTSSDTGFTQKGGKGPYERKLQIDELDELTYDRRKKAYEKDISSKADQIMEYFDCKSPGDCDNWQGSWGSMIQDITDILVEVPGLSQNLQFTIIIKFTPKQEFFGTNSHASLQVHDRNYEYGYQVGLWQSGDVRLEPLRHVPPKSKDKIFYMFSNKLDPQSLIKLTDEIKKDFKKEFIYQWVPLQEGFLNCATWAVRKAEVAGQKIPLEFGFLFHSTWQLKHHLDKRKSFSRDILFAKKK